MRQCISKVLRVDFSLGVSAISEHARSKILFRVPFAWQLGPMGLGEP